jgi:hypothetical protein
MRRVIHTFAIGACALTVAGTTGASGDVGALHVQMKVNVRSNVDLTFDAAPLQEGGYYYAVIVLRPYKHYTKNPPPCSVSSDMQRTDYGYSKGGKVALALTPAKSRTSHWCSEGTYEGAVYAVAHAPPCESAYPCRSEPYEAPCAGIGPGCLEGEVARPKEWHYPDPLPGPLSKGATVIAHFLVRFPRASRS